MYFTIQIKYTNGFTLEGTNRMEQNIQGWLKIKEQKLKYMNVAHTSSLFSL